MARWHDARGTKSGQAAPSAMLQIELSLARIMDPPGAPRAGSGLRTRFGWMERRRPHPPARFICALSGFGLGQKLRRHFNPPWWGSVRSVGHGTITGAMACHRVPAPPRAAARRDRCVARCRRRCASAAPASPSLACLECGVSTTLSSDGTGSYGDAVHLAPWFRAPRQALAEGDSGHGSGGVDPAVA